MGRAGAHARESRHPELSDGVLAVLALLLLLIFHLLRRRLASANQVALDVLQLRTEGLIHVASALVRVSVFHHLPDVLSQRVTCL